MRAPVVVHVYLSLLTLLLTCVVNMISALSITEVIQDVI